MSRLQDKITFYDSLAALVRAGVSLATVFQRGHFPPSYRHVSNSLIAALQQGHRLSEAMAASAAFSRLETTLVAAGEASGAIDQACIALRDWFTTNQRLRRQIISGLVYPILIYYVACPLLYVIHSASHGMNFTCGLPALFIMFALPPVIWLLYRLLSPVLLVLPAFGQLVEHLPIVGRLQHSLEGTRFFFPLHLCLDAGLSYKDSIALCAECCVTSYYRMRYLRLIPLLEYHGQTFDEAFANTMTSQERRSAIPALLATAQQAGAMSDFTGRIATMLSEEGEQRLKLIGNLVPKLIYFALVFFLAYKIISAWMGYFEQINSLL